MNSKKNHEYVFGPVPSRRLGRSLGVDLVPFKTCSYDCIYCQLGRTTKKTLSKQPYVPLLDVLREVYDTLDEVDVPPDYITLSGSGEPTLYSRLADVVMGIKAKTEIPVAMITNGSMLWDPEVRQALQGVDLILPSLDAGDSEMFKVVNRPHPALEFEQMLEGLAQFREETRIPMWLEICLLGGLTDSGSQVEKLASLARSLRPERIQLNTATRPPAETFAFPLSNEALRLLAKAFGGHAEVIAEKTVMHDGPAVSSSYEAVLDLLRRRPCTLEGVTEGLAVHPHEALKYLELGIKEGIVDVKKQDNGIIYTIHRQ